jgi:hypothetical protein
MQAFMWFATAGKRFTVWWAVLYQVTWYLCFAAFQDEAFKTICHRLILDQQETCGGARL